MRALHALVVQFMFEDMAGTVTSGTVPKEAKKELPEENELQVVSDAVASAFLVKKLMAVSGINENDGNGDGDGSADESVQLALPESREFTKPKTRSEVVQRVREAM